MALQEGAESWLTLYRSDKPQDLLLLPFPDHNAKHYDLNGKSVKLGGGSGLAVGNDPLIATENPSVRITIQAGSRDVNLNEREERKSRRLRGITLGGIEYILRSSHNNGVAAKFQPVVEEGLLRFMTEKGGGLITALQLIGRIRNRHAHISAMPQAQYQKLHDLILSPEEDVSESVLGKILRMKINILECSIKVD